MSRQTDPIHVTRDLMDKVSRDVEAALSRTLAISGSNSLIPVAVAAGGSGVTAVASILAHGEVQPEDWLLAALVIARACMNESDFHASAKLDLDALRRAGRISDVEVKTSEVKS